MPLKSTMNMKTIDLKQISNWDTIIPTGTNLRNGLYPIASNIAALQKWNTKITSKEHFLAFIKFPIILDSTLHSCQFLISGLNPFGTSLPVLALLSYSTHSSLKEKVLFNLKWILAPKEAIPFYYEIVNEEVIVWVKVKAYSIPPQLLFTSLNIDYTLMNNAETEKPEELIEVVAI